MDAILAIVLPVFALIAAGYLAGRGGLRLVEWNVHRVFLVGGS